MYVSMYICKNVSNLIYYRKLDGNEYAGRDTLKKTYLHTHRRIDILMIINKAVNNEYTHNHIFLHMSYMSDCTYVCTSSYQHA